MDKITVSKPPHKFTRAALLALSSWILCALLPATSAWANANDFYTGSYDYGGEAVHLFVEVDQRGPETIKLRRLLSREHRIDTRDYILLAVVIDNLDANDAGFARLSVGGHKGPDIQTADFQTRLLAPADERRNWNLYLSRDAKITGFTAILAPRAYSNYRGDGYGYYDRGYLNNSTFYGWIWRDRYYQHPRGHRYYNPRNYNRYNSQRYDRRFDGRYNRARDRHYRSHRDNNLRRNRQRQVPDQNTNQTQRPARPGFGDRDIYEHERTQRPKREERVRGNHEYRGERRNNQRNNQRRNNRERINTERRQSTRAAAPRAERPRTRTQPRQQNRPQPRQQRQQRAQSNQARAQRRPQLSKQRSTRAATPRADQTRQRSQR